VADPWTEDLAALGDRSRHQLRSIAATRASALPQLQETKMRLFKTHPVLATALAVMLVAALGGGAYAFVDRVLLSVDPDKSASEIERDVQTQLDNANIPATAHATKEDHKVSVSIEATDPSVGDKIGVAVPDGGQALRMEVLRQLSDAENTELAAFETDLEKLDYALTGDALKTTLVSLLAQHGFTQGVAVTVTDTTITITLR